MQTQHSDSLEQPVDEVIGACFKAYGVHLEDLEKKDIASLKKRIGELKGMGNNLAKDLSETDRTKKTLLHEREQDLIPNNNPGERRNDTRARLRVQGMMNDLEQKKEDLMSMEQDYLKEQAEEMKQGADQLYEVNYSAVHDLYDKAKEALQHSLDAQ